jgi:hypothetical protein
VRKQLLTHARIAVDRLTATVTRTGEWAAVVAPASLTAAHLRVRVRNTPPAPTVTGARAPPATLAAINVAAYSSVLRDDAALRSGLAALAKAAQATDAGSSSSGTAIDLADVLVEVLPAPETLTAADMVLRLREFRPAAGGAGGGGAKPSAATLSSAVEVVADRAATTATLATLIRSIAPAAAAAGTVLRIAKPAAFGPPTTAATAAALKWEALPAGADSTPIGDGAAAPAVPTLAVTSLSAAPLSLRDGAALLWRCDVPTAADATPPATGPKTGAAAARQYGRVARGGATAGPFGGSGSGGGSGGGGGATMDGMVVIKGGSSTGATSAAGRGERGVRIRMAGGPSPVNAPPGPAAGSDADAAADASGAT